MSREYTCKVLEMLVDPKWLAKFVALHEAAIKEFYEKCLRNDEDDNEEEG